MNLSINLRYDLETLQIQYDNIQVSVMNKQDSHLDHNSNILVSSIVIDVEIFLIILDHKT